jgi:tetratricopeptide (TPR) repeat protein
MKNVAVLSRVGALCAFICFFGVTRTVLHAQTTTENPSAKSATPEELSQAELLKSYLQMRDQLIANQLAIANTRAEAESNSRAQATAIAEKLEAIKSAMETDRQRQQIETLRLNAERERQQIEAQRSNRTVLWVAVGFGAIGFLAMLIMPLLQWRAINRMAEFNSRSPALKPQAALLAAETDELPTHAVTHSNQRLMSVIERMEKRILELEHTATPPLPATPISVTATEHVNGNSPAPTLVPANGHESAAPAAATTNGNNPVAEPHNRLAPLTEESTRITVLLGKGKFLLNTNKAKEAVACYDDVLKLDPKNTEALVKKGAALEKLKQDDAAIECYERAIAVNRKMTIAYLSKAGVCNRLGRYDEAMACYERALQMEEGK